MAEWPEQGLGSPADPTARQRSSAAETMDAFPLRRTLVLQIMRIRAATLRWFLRRIGQGFAVPTSSTDNEGLQWEEQVRPVWRLQRCSAGHPSTCEIVRSCQKVQSSRYVKSMDEFASYRPTRRCSKRGSVRLPGRPMRAVCGAPLGIPPATTRPRPAPSGRQRDRSPSRESVRRSGRRSLPVVDARLRLRRGEKVV